MPGDHDDPASSPPEANDNLAVPEHFDVVDDASANWVVRRIISARQYRQHVDEWATREQARADREEQFFLFRYGPALEQWARRRLAELGGRRKSLPLPAGTLGFRTCQNRLVIEQEDAARSWAKRVCPDALIIAERLSITTLREYIHRTGELPDGVRLDSGREAFFIR